MHQPVKKVVIAGGGTAGWMAAAALGKVLGKTLDITLVESDEIGTVGVGEATIPTILTLHEVLKIKEQDFLTAVQGTFKLGISFENWRDVGEDYIHSFGFTGKDHWAAGFQHFWLKGQQLGMVKEYGEYCAEWLAAKQNRFAVLPNLTLNYVTVCKVLARDRGRKWCGASRRQNRRCPPEPFQRVYLRAPTQ